jgi:hypothetical protein
MSTTNQVEKPRFSAVLSGANVTIYLNGKSHSFVFEKEEEAEDFLKNLNGMYQNKDYASLLAAVDPAKRFKISDYIERDRNGRYYVKGVNIPIVEGLTEKIKKFLELGLDIEPLVNFWKLLAINPDLHVRESLFKFAERFSFPITKSGYFIAYKSVAWKGQTHLKYAQVISENFLNVISNGHNPNEHIVVQIGESYVVYENEEEMNAAFEDYVKAFKSDHGVEVLRHKMLEDFNASIIFEHALKYGEPTLENVPEFYESIEYDFVEPDWKALTIEHFEWGVKGSLSDCYSELINLFKFDEEVFTDWHSKTQTIRLGEPVSMPRELCDNNPSNTCSTGLHVGAPGYVKSFGYGRDNYILACLVNPAHVVAIPHDYSYEKMRTSEYFPFAICKMEDGAIEEVKSPYFEYDYISIEKEEIEKRLAELPNEKESESDEQLKELYKNRLITIDTIEL